MTWNNIRRVADEEERVTKYVFTKDDAVAEAVLYRYPDYRTRTVICCSTMSGCPVGCRFCGSGDYFVRNLTAQEIVDQVEHCLDETFMAEFVSPQDIERLQIMFMSMGEPLLNLKHLIPAMEILHERYPNAALLVSTSAPDVDYAPLYEAAKRIDKIGLQFSVHESTNTGRNALVPFKKKLTLEQIAGEGARFYWYTGRKPFFNYCAHGGNSSDQDADRIYEMYEPLIWNATVSVVCERSEGLPTSNEHQRELASSFAAKLVECGFDVRVFDPAGQDTIGGGCGQLWFVQQWMQNNPDKAKPTAGFGKPVIHVPLAA